MIDEDRKMRITVSESIVTKTMEKVKVIAMKIEKIEEARVILDNPGSKHCYFAWPTITRLKNDRIAVAASGFRLAHVCPFGKAVMAISEDEGGHYTAPMPIIDTVLDDRDAGLCAFGENGLILTSFNNTVRFQRSIAREDDQYRLSYLAMITEEEEKAALGATFRISHDNGVTFGPLHHAPVSSPHGPLELPDGRLYWMGRHYDGHSKRPEGQDYLAGYDLNPETGEMIYAGRIPPLPEGARHLLSCEPHVLLLPSGRMICHIRAQSGKNDAKKIFTIYQSESDDLGRTWSEPHQILADLGGSPAHLIRPSSGVLISVYGYREAPYGVKVMFSRDDGETWDTDHDLYINGVSWDLGYPASVELKDGSLLTVFYARPKNKENTEIMQMKWRILE